ncbi:unnamed protein product [Moneuplotes crassus]|uniref:Uncharacterized protein n=2 Tax=Euplotes crassus TaxID=5936 RepID=A0AAD1XIF1_EUPCR|nr:unnamed protein product [Moneuplotes crassus]
MESEEEEKGRLMPVSIEDKHEGLAERDEKGEVSPKIWVPLSLVIAFFYAIGNVLISSISTYRFKAIALMSIGRAIGNLIPLFIISFSPTPSTSSPPSFSNSRVGLKWFYDIFYYSAGERRNEVQWGRVGVGVVMWVLGTIYPFFFVISYSFAGLANLNTGVLMSIYAMKPVLSSIMFYFIFNQTLKAYELVAIVFCMAGALVIGISSGEEDVENGGVAASNYVVIACCLLLISLFLLCIRAVILKYYFGTAKEVNVSALFNFICFISDLSMIAWFIVLIIQEFDFTLYDFAYATVSSIIFSLCGYLIAYVNVRGKAGVADALIETALIYQTILEIIVFSRYPNTLQYTGLFLGISATFFLLLCNHYCQP